MAVALEARAVEGLEVGSLYLLQVSHECTMPVEQDSCTLPQVSLDTRMTFLKGPNGIQAHVDTGLSKAFRWAVLSLKKTEACWASQTYCSMAFFFKSIHPAPTLALRLPLWKM